MKKVVSLILCFLLCMFSLAPITFAANEEKDFFEDGSYLTVGFGVDEADDDYEEETESESISFIARIIQIFRKIIAFLLGKDIVEAQTVSKTKYAKYYDKNGNLLWAVYLSAEFSYNGEKANCTKVSVSHSIKDSDWKLLISDSEKFGNTATGSFTVQQYKLGVKLKTVERTLSLTCDKNGNVK